MFEVFLTLHGIQKAPEALVWLTDIQGCRRMVPGSYQCQKVKESHAYIHEEKGAAHIDAQAIFNDLHEF